MKRIVILVLSALLLLSALTACSASGYIGDPYYPDGYSNVSTTRDGTVNGVNDRRSAPAAYDGAPAGGRQGTVPARTPAGTNTYTGTQNGTSTYGGAQNGTNTYTGTTSGTGMAGGK